MKDSPLTGIITLKRDKILFQLRPGCKTRNVSIRKKWLGRAIIEKLQARMDQWRSIVQWPDEELKKGGIHCKSNQKSLYLFLLKSEVEKGCMVQCSPPKYTPDIMISTFRDYAGLREGISLDCPADLDFVLIAFRILSEV